jgi:hypothetical protein
MRETEEPAADSWRSLCGAAAGGARPAGGGARATRWAAPARAREARAGPLAAARAGRKKQETKPRAGMGLGFSPRDGHFIPSAVKKMNGLDLLGHTIRRPVILDLPGGSPWRHHIYVYYV